MSKRFKVSWNYLTEIEEEILTYEEFRKRLTVFSHLTDNNLDRIQSIKIRLSDPCHIKIKRLKNHETH